MARYANSFWSPDYITGIDKLSRQSSLSLSQLHELRKFVFNYMKYFHNNGESLANLADSSYTTDSSFRMPRESRINRVFSGARKISNSVQPAEESLSFDMENLFRHFGDRTRDDSRLHQKAAAEIDRLVLEKITTFLKHYEPHVKTQVADLLDSYDEYKQSYCDVESAKHEFLSIARLGEFSIKETDEESKEMADRTHDLEAKTEPSGTAEAATQDNGVGEMSRIRYPVVISGIPVFPDAESLAKFIKAIVKSIPLTKRKIPLPGYRNEVFSSEILCETFRREKPRGFNPTRSNLEKLGQTLLDLKILVGTGFFTKKFSSEGMWFEWSDLASKIFTNSLKSGSSNIREPVLNELAGHEGTWSAMTSSTTKKFDGVLKSMQNTLTKASFSEVNLNESERKYNEAYECLQKSKHLLEMRILDVSHRMESFEKLKIELIYHSLGKLSQIIQSTNAHLALDFKIFAERLVPELYKPENHELEFFKGLNMYSTGVYFPSLLAPDQLTNRNTSTSQLNTNFQNIKLDFNLFRDIPLQTRLQKTQPALPLSLHSLPIFLFETVKSIERFSKEELSAAWTDPVNYQQYWLMKDALINKLQNFRITETSNTQTNIPELALMSKSLEFVKDKDLHRQVGFLKNWLLEISDSIIPSTIHDSLITNYKIEKGNEQRITETLKILGAIPRSNLSSLVYVLEHIARTFNLDVLESYGISDAIENSEPQIAEATLCALCTELNSSEAIAAIPLLHLIMRPSVVKNARGYLPPIKEYNALLADLLSLSTRRELFDLLVASEKHYIFRQEQQKHNLGIHRIKEQREISSSIERSKQQIPSIDVTRERHVGEPGIQEPMSPKPIKNESFELRPFRTGTTPKPSPSASPVAPIPKHTDHIMNTIGPLS